MARQLINPHPGVILKEEFLVELGMSQNNLARCIGVPSNRIHEIVAGKRKVTAETDLRLSKYFNLSAGYWLRLQIQYDLMNAKRQYSEKIDEIVPLAQ